MVPHSFPEGDEFDHESDPGDPAWSTTLNDALNDWRLRNLTGDMTCWPIREPGAPGGKNGWILSVGYDGA